MTSRPLILLAFTVVLSFAPRARADVVLATAGNFAVLAGSTVTNTGPTVID